ncbi:hypothetical protein BC938DRAFT_479867 [Jimgerdemannia flammicorona]|uniref:Uncharacterized protein n=1 Tax=Jimgerdemannia flammicorona TaxID=994334 RepID=A0A433QK01_9FUNG|nr:hypothetical protein BC938DRAFT_479867 [Jimgerdemannia flammicorona]
MSLNTRKTTSLVCFPLLVYVGNSQLTTSLPQVPGKSSAASPKVSPAVTLRKWPAEVAAAQAVVSQVMKTPLPSVLVADNVVPVKLRQILNRGLEVVAAGPNKDYYPGTNEKVQTLIHPSLFA